MTVDGTRLYFRLEGRNDAPRLLLLHPVGADHSLWDAVVPILVRRYQVLRPDLRGHGGSSTPPLVEYDIASMADDILGLCSQLGWARFAACGVSIGGITALQMAAQAPDRVTALVICSAAARMQERPGGWQARAQAVLAQGLAAHAQGMVERMFSAGHRATHDPLIDTLRQVFVRTDPAGYAASLAVLRDADLTARLPDVDVPVLVVTGREDPLIPPVAAQVLIAGLPQASHLELDTGHLPPVEAPQAFVEAVDAFLHESMVT
jgi:3-oxoadipate enol-lactonase